MLNAAQNFQFSQTNLQDFLDCPRQFELRHILKLRWPALRTESYQELETYIDLGHQFHHLAHQYFLGIPVDLLNSQIDHPELSQWWKSFTENSFVRQIPNQAVAEITLRAVIAEQIVVAKFDCISLLPNGDFWIIDWKTSRHPTQPLLWQKRIQSRLYPMLFVLAGSSFNRSRAVQPEKLEMIYWFATFPEQPYRMRYDAEMYKNDFQTIQDLLIEISTIKAGEFALTLDEKKCKFCDYRSLCNRGVSAGNWAAASESLEDLLQEPFLLDFEQDDQSSVQGGF